MGSKPVHLEPLRSSKEGHEHASMPANTLVKFLREVFVKENETEAVYSLIPLTGKEMLEYIIFEYFFKN